MIRFTAEIFPGGDKSRRKEVAVFNIANIGRDSEGLTQYLYSIEEPDPIGSKAIDKVGFMKFERRHTIPEFLLKVLTTSDCDRIMTEKDFKTVYKMRSL